MARIVPIRIRKSDEKEYKRLAKNTKAKIRRTNKNYGIDLSSEIDIPKLSDFSTRKQFNEWKENVESFTNRGNLSYQFQKNKYGVVASKKEISVAKRKTRYQQLKAKKLIDSFENKPFYNQGKKESTVGQQMKQTYRPNVGINIPADFNFDSIQSKNILKDRLASIEEKSDEDYYNKRMNTMKHNFADILDMTNNEAKSDLTNRIRKLNDEDFYELYLMTAEMDFSLYDSEGNEDVDQGNFRAIENYLDLYDAGKIDLSLKNF